MEAASKEGAQCTLIAGGSKTVERWHGIPALLESYVALSLADVDALLIFYGSHCKFLTCPTLFSFSISKNDNDANVCGTYAGTGGPYSVWVSTGKHTSLHARWRNTIFYMNKKYLRSTT